MQQSWILSYIIYINVDVIYKIDPQVLAGYQQLKIRPFISIFFLKVRMKSRDFKFLPEQVIWATVLLSEQIVIYGSTALVYNS